MLNIHDITIHSYTKHRRKTISISIAPSGEVTLKAPLHVSDAHVYDFVKRKKKWIQKKLEYFAQHEEVTQGPLISGQEILFLGEAHQLIIDNSGEKEGIEIKENKLILHTFKPENDRHNKRLLDRWLFTQAEYIFHERLSHILQNFPDLARPVLKIRKYKSRWGSYASNHVMALNSLIVQAPLMAIDYVINHELCHHYHKKHDAIFYALLAEKMPNWKEGKNKLKQKFYA